MSKICTKQELLQTILDDWHEKDSLAQNYSKNRGKGKREVTEEALDYKDYYNTSFIWVYLQDKFSLEAESIKEYIKSSDTYISMEDAQSQMIEDGVISNSGYNQYSRYLALFDIIIEEIETVIHKSDKAELCMTYNQLLEDGVISSDLDKRISEFEDLSKKKVRKKIERVVLSKLADILGAIFEDKGSRMLRRAVRDYFNGYGIRITDEKVEVPYTLRDDVSILRKYEDYVEESSAFKSSDTDVSSVFRGNYDEEYIEQCERLYERLLKQENSDFCYIPIALNPLTLEGIFIIGEESLCCSGKGCCIIRIIADDIPITYDNEKGSFKLTKSLKVSEYGSIKEAFDDFIDFEGKRETFLICNDFFSDEDYDKYVPERLKLYFDKENFTDKEQSSIEEDNNTKRSDAGRRELQKNNKSFLEKSGICRR